LQGGRRETVTNAWTNSFMHVYKRCKGKQARLHPMLEVVLVYVGVQALIMLYGREQPTRVKSKQD
jgi:hypothetical protein